MQILAGRCSAGGLVLVELWGTQYANTVEPLITQEGFDMYSLISNNLGPIPPLEGLWLRYDGFMGVWVMRGSTMRVDSHAAMKARI